MSRDDTPKRRRIKLGAGSTCDLFFIWPTITIMSEGIGLLWMFWGISISWEK